MTKRCNRCECHKSHSEFLINPRTDDGLYKLCKKCIAWLQRKRGPRRKYQTRITSIDECPPLPQEDGLRIIHCVGLPGIAADSNGEIWSCRNRGWTPVVWRKLSRRATNADGYVTSMFAVGTGSDIKSIKFATLVCEAFHGARPDGMQVCHTDGTRTHDWPSNLYWGTPIQNSQDRIRHGRNHGVDPELVNTAKLTWETALWIRSQQGLTNRHDLALQFGVTPSTIAAVWYNRTWKTA